MFACGYTERQYYCNCNHQLQKIPVPLLTIEAMQLKWWLEGLGRGGDFFWTAAAQRRHYAVAYTADNPPTYLSL